MQKIGQTARSREGKKYHKPTTKNPHKIKHHKQPKTKGYSAETIRSSKKSQF